MAPGGLGTRQVPGRMSAQGPSWAAPRHAGGSEDRGPLSQTPPGLVALSSERDWGRPAERGGPGEAQDGRAPRPPCPSPHPPGPARTHPRPAAGGPRSPPGPRARPGGCWPSGGGGGSVRWKCSGPWRRWQAGVRSRVVRLKYSTCPRGEVQLASPTGRSERKGGTAQGS